MANGNGIPIDLEVFAKLNADDRTLAIAKMLVYMSNSGYECAEDRHQFRDACQKRIKALEDRKLKDSGRSGILGLFGGSLVMLTRWFFGG